MVRRRRSPAAAQRQPTVRQTSSKAPASCATSRPCDAGAPRPGEDDALSAPSFAEGRGRMPDRLADDRPSWNRAKEICDVDQPKVDAQLLHA
jgi:hypothetical protein